MTPLWVWHDLLIKKRLNLLNVRAFTVYSFSVVVRLAHLLEHWTAVVPSDNLVYT